MMKKHLILVAGVGFCLTGCLQTRSDVKTGEQRQVLQQQVGTLQKTNADTANRISDLEEQLRFMNGRVEVLEAKLSSSGQEAEQQRRNAVEVTQSHNQKFAVYQEALEKMEQTVQALQTELNNLRAQQLSDRVKGDSSREQAKGAQDPYESADSHFEKKEFKAAILEYQKYVEKNPKGKKVASATYKIGVSFQELGMKNEAKAFYDEVITNFPKSDEARKAKSRLKNLK
jgi:TolA-binding protein